MVEPRLAAHRHETAGTSPSDENRPADLPFSVPDHERPADSNRDNVYNFTVHTTDDRYYGTLHVTVTVTPVNEAPTITTTSTICHRRCVTRRTAPPACTPTGPRTRSVGTIAWSLAGYPRQVLHHRRSSGASSSSARPPRRTTRTPQGSGADGQEYEVTVQASDDSNFAQHRQLFP